jgi:putative restriction endonuclease
VDSLDLDWRLRLAAFAALPAMRDAGGGVVRLADLERGFEFEGKRIPLMNARRGIWRPHQLGRDGAALSVVTTPPKRGKAPPYDDQVASDDGKFVYRYEGDDPDLWTNRAVRRAMELRLPLVYLYGVQVGLYDAIFPCYVAHDHPRELAFYLEADVLSQRPIAAEDEFLGDAPRREYETRAVKVRLHQRRFRELVVRAYRERCAVCQLRHPELLDGAHILPDRDERGRPEVPNGLSLCKIHHGAFDAEILGIDPDYRIHIRRDVLEEHDGPMLRHGLQEMDRQPLLVPAREALRPNREYLGERFARFRAA